MKKTLFFMSILLSMALALSGCASQPKMGSGGKVLATSGDEKILLSAYLYALNMTKITNEYYLEQSGYGEQDKVEYWLTETGEGRTMGDDLKDYVLDQLKYSSVFVKLGKADGITYDKDTYKEYETAINNAVINMNSKEKTGERAFYDTYWVTKEEALEAEKIISISDQYMKKIEDTLTVTPEEIAAYYEEHKDELHEVTVAHILIKFPESGLDAEKAEKKTLAEEILARAQAGEDFGAMAAEYSEDEGSKDNNGEYTVNKETPFVQEFLDWSFESGEGDMGIIETMHGYHVMKFIKTSTFEDLQTSIEETLIDTKYNEALNKVIEENPMEWTVDEELLKSISLSGPAAA